MNFIMATKINWNRTENKTMAGQIMPERFWVVNHTATVGKIGFSINETNKRLSARIGSNLTFKGGKNDDGYFESIDAAKAYVEQWSDEFAKCGTMNKLIYIGIKKS